MKSTVRAITDAVEAAEGKLPPKKRRLVDAAVICFARHGYDATSTRMIADRAGVAEATIFRHFGSKKQLLLRLVEPVLGQLLAPVIEQEARQFFSRIDDLPEFLRTMMLSRLRFADNYAPLVRILLQELPVNADLRALVANELGGPVLDIARGELRRLCQSGKMKNIKPEQFVRLVASLLVGFYVTRTMIAPGNWDDEAEVALMVDALCNGLIRP